MACTGVAREMRFWWLAGDEKVESRRDMITCMASAGSLQLYREYCILVSVSVSVEE